MNYTCKSPVVLLIYKRPELTKKLIESLAAVKPRELFVVSDGPKNKDEKKAVEECRALIEKISWKCVIHKNYADTNMGLAERVPSGISWALSQRDCAIILEDDCIADPTFFRFCDELLERYKTDERVMTIAGSNFLFGKGPQKFSYYFSQYAHCWGWATWARAWNKYDHKMTDWPKQRNDWINDVTTSPLMKAYWKGKFDLVYQNEINSWAYRWMYSNWVHRGLTICPKVNMVTNIGFTADATSKKRSLIKVSLPAEKLTWPLKHNPTVVADVRADKLTNKNHYLPPQFSPYVLYLMYKSLRFSA